MRSTKTLLGNKARQAVAEGVRAIYEPTRLTLGPQAKKALLYRTYNRGSRIADDGYMVAECQEPKDDFVRLASTTFKEAVKKTNEIVGDGTTTTAVVGGKLFEDAYRLLSDSATEYTRKGSKIGVMTLRKNILETAQKAKDEIKKVAKKVSSLEELEKIAIVSVEDVELGKVIAKMAWEVGVDGFIDVVEGYKGEIETEVIKGMRFPAKVAAKAFVNNSNRYEMIAKDAPVLITNHAFDNAGDSTPMFSELNTKGITKIIVIASSFSENVLVNMYNATQAGYFFFPVSAGSLRTEQFEDLAIYCGAKFIDKNKGSKIRNVKEEDLGFLEKLVVKETDMREDAVATGGKGTLEETVSVVDMVVDEKGKKEKVYTEKKTTQVAERLAILKAQVDEQRQDTFKKLLQRRVASMASAVGVIRVGASTQASSLYRKLKIEDAVYACKAALRGGYIKGGGLCLKEIAETLPDTDILKSALIAPYEQIQSSIDGGIEIGDEIIDPADVSFYAVEHATSVVANLITVEILTVEESETSPLDGYREIAKAINEYVISQKIQMGQLKENEREMERDRMGGMSYEEKVSLDQG